VSEFELPAGDFAGFIFDCDGTLADSMPLYHRAWQRALADHGATFEFTWELFMSRAGMSTALTVEGLNATFGTALEAEAVEVSVAVARKLAPELIAAEPLTEVVALAKRCFKELISAPHVVARVNDSLYASVRGPIEDVARARGYEGRLVVLGEPEIQIGDCRIEWADGGLTRDRGATEAAIAEMVGNYVAARRGKPAQR